MINKKFIKTSVLVVTVIIAMLFASRAYDYYNRRENNQTRYYDKNYSFEKAYERAVKSVLEDIK